MKREYDNIDELVDDLYDLISREHHRLRKEVLKKTLLQKHEIPSWMRRSMDISEMEKRQLEMIASNLSLYFNHSDENTRDKSILNNLKDEYQVIVGELK